jgi:hypothetical protein
MWRRAISSSCTRNTVSLSCLAASWLLEVQHKAPSVAGKLLLLRVELQRLLYNLLLHLVLPSRKCLLLLLLLSLALQLCTSSSGRSCSCCCRLHATAPALLARVLVIVTVISLCSSLPCSAVLRAT